jgi:hypothetical protein
VITADDVLAMAESWYPDRSPIELLAVLRAEQERFVPTWLSAWATREALPAPLAAEVTQTRARAEAIRGIGERVLAAVPGARTIKGLTVSDLYPAGLARLMSDLDVVVPDAGAVWRVAEVAAADFGAEVRAVSTFPVRPPGRRGLVIGMQAPQRLALEHPVGLDVSTHALVGNGSTVPARAWIGRPGGPELAAHLLLIAARPLERRYGLKQLLDAAVLADALGPAGIARARQLAGPLGLLPELRGIFQLAVRHGLPVPEPPVGTGAARLARARRVAGFAVASRRRPLRASLQLLQHTELRGPEASPGRRRAWQVADRRLPVLSPARDGLFRFGLPVTVRGATDRPLLRTPFGDYLLVTGSEVTEDWLDDGLVPAGTGESAEAGD